MGNVHEVIIGRTNSNASGIKTTCQAVSVERLSYVTRIRICNSLRLRISYTCCSSATHTHTVL